MTMRPERRKRGQWPTAFVHLKTSQKMKNRGRRVWSFIEEVKYNLRIDRGHFTLFLRRGTGDKTRGLVQMRTFSLLLLCEQGSGYLYGGERVWRE